MTELAVPLLDVNGLRRSFAGIKAIDGLDFSVAEGSITGIIGPNGCGKTTAVNCITGFDSNYRGAVEFSGQSIAHQRPDTIAREGVIRTFQAIRVFDDLSVLQNVMIGRQSFDGLHWWDLVSRSARFQAVEVETRERAKQRIAQVGLTEKAADRAGELSYGQKKLLALATALMSSPKLIILDEPVAGVNPTLAGEIAETLRELNRTGISFLIIEHNIDFIMSLCDEVIVMDRGRTLTAGSPESVRADDRVIEAYLGGGRHDEK